MKPIDAVDSGWRIPVTLVLALGSSLQLLGAAAKTQIDSPAVPRFRTVTIDSQIGIGYGVAVADVDGDRKTDVLLVDKDQVAWYQNPSWTKHVIAEKLSTHDHVCIAAADVDGDGKAEIAIGAEWNPSDTTGSGRILYLIPPADRARKWGYGSMPHEPTVHRMKWATNSHGKAELVVVPLHGRGNNPATGEGSGVKVLAYQRPATVHEAWITRTLADSLHKMHNFDVVQTDADPAAEFYFASKQGVFSLKESTLRPDLGLRLIGTNNIGGAGEVREFKEGSRRWGVAAIEPMHGHTVAVYLPEQAPDGLRPWKRVVLDESLIDGHALVAADFLGLGRDQIVAGWRAMNRAGAKVGLKLYVPTDTTGQKWTTHVIDDNTMACEDLAVGDFNGDGKPDLVAAGRSTRNLKIYFNEAAPR